MDDNWYLQGMISNDTSNPNQHSENAGPEMDPLRLSGIDDDELIDIIDKHITDERSFYTKKYKLYERRRQNETYYFGRQVQEAEDNQELKNYEARNLDNVLWEIEQTIKPLAMTQLPDLIVTPGSETDQSKTTASLLTKAINSDIKRRQNRKVLAMAFKHLPVYYIGVIKVRWNPELEGGLGDYEFLYVHPDCIDFDWTATEADADKMNWISQLVHTNVQHVMMQFPKAKSKFIEELKLRGVMGKDDIDPDWKALATPIDIREVWFTDYKEDKDGKWQRVEGVCWKYEGCLLDKMKNPYFDYEGESQIFTYDDPMLESSKRKISMDEMQNSMMTGVYPMYAAEEQVYHNYFKMPRKPFFFMTYDQWGKQPMDETSRIEQNIRNQRTLDKRGKQIEETLSSRGHHIWSKLAGFKPSDIQKMDHNNPDEDYLVDGLPSQVHDWVAPDRPTNQEFQDLDRTRDRMYGISGSTAIRGDIQTDVATTNQIAREANYTRADDLVEDTINPASEWMAGWTLQMIKTRYTQKHFKKILGQKGEVIFLQLQQDLVEDGMEVMIKASGTDKIQKKNMAMNMAKMQMTDPLSFFQDMDLDDPEGRTGKLVSFKADMPLYLTQFVETGPTSTPELANKLMELTSQQMQGGRPPMPGQMNVPPPTAAPGAPQNPTPGNTAQVAVAPPAGPPPGSVR